jgi:hypothetical protein
MMLISLAITLMVVGASLVLTKRYLYPAILDRGSSLPLFSLELSERLLSILTFSLFG